jgi:cytosine/adenosine deaminase-related metal-dependent hydrolase
MNVDLLLREVTVLTAEPNTPALRDAAVAVAGDRIGWLGPDREAPQGARHELGSVPPGKKADLVGFDFRSPHLAPAADPLGCLVHGAHGRDVEMVLVAGSGVVEDGRATMVDGARIVTDAQRAANALWARARAA